MHPDRQAALDALTDEEDHWIAQRQAADPDDKVLIDGVLEEVRADIARMHSSDHWMPPKRVRQFPRSSGGLGST